MRRTEAWFMKELNVVDWAFATAVHLGDVAAEIKHERQTQERPNHPTESLTDQEDVMWRTRQGGRIGDAGDLNRSQVFLGDGFHVSVGVGVTRGQRAALQSRDQRHTCTCWPARTPWLLFAFMIRPLWSNMGNTEHDSFSISSDKWKLEIPPLSVICIRLYFLWEETWTVICRWAVLHYFHNFKGT